MAQSHCLRSAGMGEHRARGSSSMTGYRSSEAICLQGGGVGPHTQPGLPALGGSLPVYQSSGLAESLIRRLVVHSARARRARSRHRTRSELASRLRVGSASIAERARFAWRIRRARAASGWRAQPSADCRKLRLQRPRKPTCSVTSRRAHRSAARRKRQFGPRRTRARREKPSFVNPAAGPPTAR